MYYSSIGFYRLLVKSDNDSSKKSYVAREFEKQQGNIMKLICEKNVSDDDDHCPHTSIFEIFKNDDGTVSFRAILTDEYISIDWVCFFYL